MLKNTEISLSARIIQSLHYYFNQYSDYLIYIVRNENLACSKSAFDSSEPSLSAISKKFDTLVVNHSVCISVLLTHLHLSIPVNWHEVAKYFTSVEIADVDVSVVLYPNASSMHFTVQCFAEVGTEVRLNPREH